MSPVEGEEDSSSGFGMNMMTDYKFSLYDDVSLKRWRLYFLRFGLLFLAWTTISMSFELPSWQSLLVLTGKGFLFSLAMSLLFYVSGRASRTARTSILVILALLSLLLVAAITRGCAPFTKGHQGAGKVSNGPSFLRE